MNPGRERIDSVERWRMIATLNRPDGVAQPPPVNLSPQLDQPRNYTGKRHFIRANRVRGKAFVLTDRMPRISGEVPAEAAGLLTPEALRFIAKLEGECRSRREK